MHLSNVPTEQLQLFQFLGFVSFSTTKTARTSRALNTRKADLTPLSISLPLQRKAKKVRSDHVLYESMIARRAFKPNKSTEYDFGSEYRGIRPTSPPAADEAGKAKKSSQCTAGLSLSMANVLAENSDIDALPLKTGQNAAEARSLAGSLLNPELEYKLHPQKYTGQTFNSDTPASFTAKFSSPVPSWTESTGEQAANVTDSDGYRLTARETHPSDQGADTDYECATESDPETHTDDDDFNYIVDAVEDEGYDTLESQFRDVRIRKRQRDDVEDAEDGNEAADTARLDDGQEQKSLQVPLTEEEEERTHLDKKLRTENRTLVANNSQDAHGTG